MSKMSKDPNIEVIENPKKTGFSNQHKGKNKYKIKDNALIILYKIKRYGDLNDKVCVYKCPYCNYWHIGRSNKNNSKLRKWI